MVWKYPQGTENAVKFRKHIAFFLSFTELRVCFCNKYLFYRDPVWNILKEKKKPRFDIDENMYEKSIANSNFLKIIIEIF